MNSYVVLKSLGLLVALWFFVYYFWRDYRLDAFRDDVFTLRDEMFLYAAQGNISFQDPAYVLLRSRMNVILRYAHEFNLFNFAAVALTPSLTLRRTNAALIEWEEAVVRLPSPIQDRMREFQIALAVKAFEHMTFASYFLYILIRGLLLIMSVVRKLTGLPPSGSQLIRSQHKLVSTVVSLESKAMEEEEERTLAAV